MDRQYRLTPWDADRTPVDHDLKWGYIAENGVAGYLLARVRRTTLAPAVRHFWPRLLGNAVPWGSYAAPTLGSFTNYAELTDGVGNANELLLIEKPNIITEAYLGSGFGNCLYYLRVPQGDLRHHLMTAMSNTPDFARPFGYHCKGSESMADAWTDAGKFVIPPYTSMEWALVNLSVNPRIVTTDFLMAQHEIDAYDPRDPTEAEVIVQMLRKQRRVNYINGRLEAYPVTQQDYNKMFSVPQVLVRKDEIYYMEKGEKHTIHSGPLPASRAAPARKGVAR